MFITTLMFLALSISVLFVSLMQSVNGGQFLNTTSLFVLLGAAAVTLLSVWDCYSSINSYVRIAIIT